MNTRARAAAIVLSATVVLGACGSDSKSSATTVKSSSTATTAKSSTETTAKPSATSTTKPATSTTKPATTISSSTSSATAIDVGTTSLGKVLVDSEGRTLYLYKKDTKGGTTSACDATCAAVWPPVEATTTPKAGTGVDATKISTITRADGTKQVTYNGMPLYRHAADTKSGDVTGEKVESEWYVVNTAGTAV